MQIDFFGASVTKITCDIYYKLYKEGKIINSLNCREQHNIYSVEILNKQP